MLTELEIRGQLLEYLTGRLTFDAFERWLIERSHNMHKDSSEAAQDLVSEIELLIYEYLNRSIVEGELKVELHGLLVPLYKLEVTFDALALPLTGTFSLPGPVEPLEVIFESRLPGEAIEPLPPGLVAHPAGTGRVQRL